MPSLAKLRITGLLFISCNARIINEHSHVVQAILIHGGPEIICDDLKPAEASFC